MNLSDIRAEAWGVAREVATDDAFRLWTTAEMNRYINRVYRHIARETKCIRDAITPAVCQIASAPPVNVGALTTLAATDNMAAADLVQYNDPNSWLYHQLVAPRVYALHPSILDIDECKWLAKPWKLIKVSVTKWQQNPWWEKVMGYPTEFCTDYQNNSIALNYRTTATDTILLTVRRLPLADLANDNDIPEIRTNYHDFFLNGVLAQMYSKQDTQTFDGVKKTEYEAQFAADIDMLKKQETTLDQRLHCNGSMDAFR